MKILILSDSHREENTLDRIIELNKDAGAIVFLGDGINDFENACAWNGIMMDGDPNVEVFYVYGNCDSFSRCTERIIRKIGGVNFYITHGVEESVKMGTRVLATMAKEAGCGVALYGHTHVRAMKTAENGVQLFNPGTASRGQYGLAWVEDGKVRFEHKEL